MTGLPQAPVAFALSRVLGLDGDRVILRSDTPLGGLGVDSLALLCTADALAEGGWHLDLASAGSASTLGDLQALCTRHGSDGA